MSGNVTTQRNRPGSGAFGSCNQLGRHRNSAATQRNALWRQGRCDRRCNFGIRSVIRNISGQIGYTINRNFQVKGFGASQHIAIEHETITARRRTLHGSGNRSGKSR